MFNNKKQAFSLIETLTTLCVIAVVAVLTVCSALNSQDIKNKKIKALSKVFYTEIEFAYTQIINSETIGRNIIYLNALDGSEESESDALAKIFQKYVELFPISCDELPNYTETGSSYYINEELVCMASNRGINAGFYLDTECDNSYQTIDYYQDDASLKGTENACGYVVYAPKNSDGIIGKDFFIIGLGKRRIK